MKLTTPPVDYWYYKHQCKYGSSCRTKTEAHFMKYLHPCDLLCVPNRAALVILECYRTRLRRYKANVDTLKCILTDISLAKKVPPNKIDFSGLDRLFLYDYTSPARDTFFETILPQIISCALEFFSFDSSIFRLCPRENTTEYKLFKLNRRQVLSILCNSFLCTFDDELRAAVKNI